MKWFETYLNPGRPGNPPPCDTDAWCLLIQDKKSESNPLTG